LLYYFIQTGSVFQVDKPCKRYVLFIAFEPGIKTYFDAEFPISS